ncbi:MAG TPA: DUF374 domain-containing protein [Devosiaceae bacterium]|nr:DUF374 domain-containing protein [Devosiaceae bacterium]
MTEAAAPSPTAKAEFLWSRRLAGQLLALYVRLVKATAKIVYVPEDMHERYLPLEPSIYVSWHANVLAVPLFIKPGMAEVVGLASPHPDGQIAAACINALGIRTILGTGANEKATHGMGGMAAFRSLMRELKAGNSVFLTAEVPPTRGRQVSKGVIALARMSGRPIVGIAAASSRRTIIEKLWDKMQINHPFSRLALVAVGPVMVDKSVTDDEAADKLKRLLDDAYAEALRLADAKS